MSSNPFRCLLSSASIHWDSSGSKFAKDPEVGLGLSADTILLIVLDFDGKEEGRPWLIAVGMTSVTTDATMDKKAMQVSHSEKVDGLDDMLLFFFYVLLLLSSIRYILLVSQVEENYRLIDAWILSEISDSVWV